MLASDTKASSTGPTKLKVGNITVFSKKGVTINGLQKIYTSRNETVAVGIAGTVQDHAYLSAFEKSRDFRGALQSIRQHSDSLLLRGLEEKSNSKAAKTNSLIATHFESVIDNFVSTYFEFGLRKAGICTYPATDEPMINYTGSGSTVINDAMGVENIEAFRQSIVNVSDPQTCIDWIRLVYQKVSEIDPGTNSESRIIVATKESPLFSVV